MLLHRRLFQQVSRLRGLLQLLAVLTVLFLQNQAFAAIFAPMCDPSGATVPVAAPASEGDIGVIDAWTCGDGPFSGREVSFKVAPRRSGESEVGASPASVPVAPAWRPDFPSRPIQKRLIWGEESRSALPNGYATGPFRPPRLTKLP